MAKVDMHCHSHYSDRPAYYILYKMGAKECYTNPQDIYIKLKSKGMDFVTITDHNTIQGALELSELYSDVFLGCEFTVSFPGEKNSVHICAYDFTEKQFNQAMLLRHDIREFAAYFHEAGVITCVPHPLHSYDGHIELRHIEQLILLFENFEDTSGLQSNEINYIQKDFLNNITPDLINDLIRKHKIIPHFQDPWRKGRLGGSDDHSSIFLGCAYTEVPDATSSKEFLWGIKCRLSIGCGEGISPVKFAHSAGINVAKTMLNLCNIKETGEDGAIKLIDFFYNNNRGHDVKLNSNKNTNIIKQNSMMNIIEGLIKDLMNDWQNPKLLFDQTKDRDLQQETFNMLNTLVNFIIRRGLEDFSESAKQGEYIKGASDLSSILSSIVFILPYIVSFKHIFNDNKIVGEIEEFYGLKSLEPHNSQSWAWFTDTISDVNGVAKTIQTVANIANSCNIPVNIICSTKKTPQINGNVKNFTPIWDFELPEYNSMTLVLPPFLEMLHYCEKNRFKRIIISTPGPVGVAALLISKILNIPTSGIYHTDVPQYVGVLTQDPFAEKLTWKFVRFIYNQLDQIYVLTNAYKKLLCENGFSHNKIKLFPKGTDIDFFNPAKRDPNLWKRWNMNGKTKILYVGRVSKEKQLHILGESFSRLRKKQKNIELVVVGDGPYLEEFKKKYPRERGVACIGEIHGEELAKIYASADIFAFPSTTDTYGSAVLEAQASGLAAIVSDKGGPQEVIFDGETGFVTKGNDIDSFSSALLKLVNDKQLRYKMGEVARERAKSKDWKQAFFKFWNEHESSTETAATY